MPSLKGIDVSSWQGKIAWEKVAAAGIQFAGMKASEGVTFSDPYFPANLAGAREHGIIPLPYHFCRMDLNDPEREVAHFHDCLAAAGGLRPGEPVAGDFEVAVGVSQLHTQLGLTAPPPEIQPLVRAAIRARRLHPMLGTTVPPAGVPADPTLPALGLSTLTWAQRWLDVHKEAAGFESMTYSGLWFMQPHGMLGDPRLAESGLWLAAYQATLPATPPSWNFIACWQNSDSGAVPGISGPVDTDFFNADSVEQIRAYGLQTPTPPSTAPFDTAARLQGCGYLAGGSGVKDMIAWLGGYHD